MLQDKLQQNPEVIEMGDPPASDPKEKCDDDSQDDDNRKAVAINEVDKATPDVNQGIDDDEIHPKKPTILDESNAPSCPAIQQTG